MNEEREGGKWDEEEEEEKEREETLDGKEEEMGEEKSIV
jgi:hypothetical protein